MPVLLKVLVTHILSTTLIPLLHSACYTLSQCTSIFHAEIWWYFLCSQQGFIRHQISGMTLVTINCNVAYPTLALFFFFFWRRRDQKVNPTHKFNLPHQATQLIHVKLAWITVNIPLYCWQIRTFLHFVTAHLRGNVTLNITSLSELLECAVVGCDLPGIVCRGQTGGWCPQRMWVMMMILQNLSGWRIVWAGRKYCCWTPTSWSTPHLSV